MITRCAAPQHGKRLINVLRPRVARNYRAAGIGLFDEIIPVVSEHRSAARRRLVDAPSERIVAERNRFACAWKRHAGQPILEVPGARRRVRASDARERVPVVVNNAARSANAVQASVLTRFFGSANRNTHFVRLYSESPVRITGLQIEVQFISTVRHDCKKPRGWQRC